MTLALARVRGFSRPQKTHTGKWFAHCPTCVATNRDGIGIDGPLHMTKGEASTDSRAHNQEHHHA